nr:hypothetical protein [Tanacetum cinerariifolium]
MTITLLKTRLTKTKSVIKEVHTELLQCFVKVEKHSISLEIALQKFKEQVKNDTVWNEQASNVFQKEREQYIKIQDLKAQLQDRNIAISELKKLIEKGKGKSMETKFDKPSVVRQPNAQWIPKPSVLGVNHKTNVSRPQNRSNQLKDKVVPKNSQSVTACNDSLNSRTSNVNAVCATCGKCLVGSNHFACVTKMLNDMNARTKKPKVVPISTRKPKGHANKSIATPHKKKVASKSTNQKPQSYYRMMYKKTTDTTILSQQELDLLFGPLYDEFFNKGTSSVNKSSSPTDNSKHQDTPPTMNNPSSIEQTTPTTNVYAKENNDNQAEDAQILQDEFINPFCTPV